MAENRADQTKSDSDGPLLKALQYLGSLKLAAVLLVILVFGRAVATLMESSRGVEISQGFVYHSGWFIALWTLVTVNILAAMLIQRPRKIRQVGGLIMHVGVVVLLAGSIYSFTSGIEGQLTFVEGQSSDTIVLSYLNQITTSWREGDTETSLDFKFRPGPVDWPAGKTKNLGESDDVGIEILGFYRHARPEATLGEDGKQAIVFRPVGPEELESSQGQLLDAAVHVKVVVGEETHEMWLQRANRRLGFRRIDTSKGTMEVSFGYAICPLGFSLTLLDFVRGLNPGGMGDASYASAVRLEDESRDVSFERTISMNQPLTHGKFTFYQSGFDKAPDGRDMSRLSVAHDPGSFMKYFGSLMVCVGTFIMFYGPRLMSRIRSNAASAKPESAIQRQASIIALFTILLSTSVSSAADQSSGATLDWGQWQRLAVQDGGRQKPLDTLARETFEKFGTGTLTHPETGKTTPAAAAFVEMLLDWQGWDQPSTAPTAYFRIHRPDQWDRAPLLAVESATLRQALGMAAGRSHISPLDLGAAEISDPETGEKMPFTRWAWEMYRSEEAEISEAEKRVIVELSEKLHSFQTLRMGQTLQVVPVEGDVTQRWMSLAELMQTDFNDETDPSGELRKVKGQFLVARTAYRKGHRETFSEASTAMIASLQELGPKRGNYPRQGTIDLEVRYNRWTPFRWAWICSLIASVALVLSICTGRKACFISARVALGATLVALLVGLAMRTVVKGSPPVTNLYESVVFAGFGAVLFGLIFGLKASRQGILAATLVIATLILALADCCPSVLDPTIRPLPPVLRSNFWLAIHVATIMLSYAAFAVALGSANVTLGFYLAGSKREDAIQTQSRFTYETLQAGTLLLVIGTFLGAAWADYSWGRFWGWDPKEVWALITLLAYLAVLHARRIPWVGNRGLAAWSVICFMLVIMTWYGVNFLSGGLHNYGLGGSAGPYYVLGALGLQLLYVAAAMTRSAGRTAATVAPID